MSETTLALSCQVSSLEAALLSLLNAIENCDACLWNFFTSFSIYLALTHFNITAEIGFYKGEVLCRSTWELFFSTRKKLILEFLFYSGRWWGKGRACEPSWPKKTLKLVLFQNADVCFYQSKALAASWHLVYCPPLQSQFHRNTEHMWCLESWISTPQLRISTDYFTTTALCSSSRK